MLNFEFLEKGLGIVSPPNFVYDFQEHSFPCCILLTDQISLTGYWPDCGVINFEINIFFFNQATFSAWLKNEYKNVNILRTK